MKCEFCKNLDEMVREYPDDPHHGAMLYCDECESEYYEVLGGTIFTCNKQAQTNHPELKVL